MRLVVWKKFWNPLRRGSPWTAAFSVRAAAAFTAISAMRKSVKLNGRRCRMRCGVSEKWTALQRSLLLRRRKATVTATRHSCRSAQGRTESCASAFLRSAATGSSPAAIVCCSQRNLQSLRNRFSVGRSSAAFRPMMKDLIKAFCAIFACGRRVQRENSWSVSFAMQTPFRENRSSPIV